MLRCGFYEMDITPFVGCRIPGSFEKRTVEDVTDAPYAKAVVIDNGLEKVAIVCSDILYIYGESYKKILDRICAHTDLKRENIMVTATHNHSGGPTDYDLHTDEDKLYVEMAWRKAADAVILANQRLYEACVGFGGVEVRLVDDDGQRHAEMAAEVGHAGEVVAARGGGFRHAHGKGRAGKRGDDGAAHAG
jgi:hypothetical protein